MSFVKHVRVRLARPMRLCRSARDAKAADDGTLARRYPSAGTNAADANRGTPRAVGAPRCRHGVRIAAMFVAAVLFAPPLFAAGLEESNMSARLIELPVGHGLIVRLDEPAESVYLADTAVADLRVVAPDVIYVYGRKIGTTNMIAVSAPQKDEATVQVRVVGDPRPANAAMHEMAPTTTTSLKMFGNRVAAGGRTNSIEEAVKLAGVAETFSPRDQPPINNSTIVGSQQVNIRVRFAEISRNDLQRLGINWTALGHSGAFSFGAGGDVDTFIAAMQRNGMLTILAEPNLTAVTGQSASFLAGGEIPIPVPQGPQGQITVQYKPFGVSLEFTPTLVGTNRIGLRVRPEVSSLSRVGAVKISGIELPSLTVRRADTTVEVASGQTFAIAGLFQRQMTQDSDSLPLLGDVPVLGELFRSSRYQRNETELVILITPYLVKPVRDRLIATPLDRPASHPMSPPAGTVRAKNPERTSGLILK
jgi:pilus assembly protein CpaC